MTVVEAFPIPHVTTIGFHGLTYLVGDFLDSGSESRIHSAKRVSGTSDDVPNDVAIKFYCPTVESHLQKIDLEVIALSALASLNTPNLIRIYAVGDVPAMMNPSEPKCRFIVLNRAGRDLERYMSPSDDFNSPLLDGVVPSVTGKLSVEAFAASVGLIICDLVDLIHKQGVAHNDIRDYNIALNYPFGDQPVLLDFGGASTRDSVSEKVFQKHRMEDHDDVVRLVRNLIGSRIIKEFGKDARSALMQKSPLVRSLLQVTEIDILRLKLSSFLLQYLEINWDAITYKEIIYHIV